MSPDLLRRVFNLVRAKVDFVGIMPRDRSETRTKLSLELFEVAYNDAEPTEDLLRRSLDFLGF